MPQLLPRGTLSWEDAVACQLQQYQAEGKHVRWLVVVAIQDFWAYVFPVALLEFDATGRRPNRGHTKVGNLQGSVKGDENICRLEVQMKESRIVDLFDSLFRTCQYFLIPGDIAVYR